MFTGIIESVGRISSVSTAPGGKRLRIGCPGLGGGLGSGDSIAVSGVCLTVVAFGDGWFEAEVSPETLRRSTLGDARSGTRVNLERPLQASGRLGGHFVQGHVDAVGKARSVRRGGKFVEMSFAYPASLKGLLVEKGSIAVNGVSLTVATVGPSTFSTALIPHTLEMTDLGGIEPGDRVNLEADVLGKYVRALLKSARAGVR
jgi:riboflavin synthase